MDKSKIEVLADHHEAIPVFKELFEAERDPYYGPEGPDSDPTITWIKWEISRH